MKNFYFTFGQRYRDDPHPTYDKANPNGWVRVVADSYENARKFGYELFGEHFATMYDESRWMPEFFPGGEIEVFNI